MENIAENPAEPSAAGADHGYEMRYLTGTFGSFFPQRSREEIQQAIRWSKTEIAPSTDRQELYQTIWGNLS